jgi:restriction endonuclease S subunit
MLGSARPLVSPKDFIKIKIPLPPLEVQKQLVAEAEKEEEIITANRRLIEIMERKIEEVLSNI